MVYSPTSSKCWCDDSFHASWSAIMKTNQFIRQIQTLILIENVFVSFHTPILWKLTLVNYKERHRIFSNLLSYLTTVLNACHTGSYVNASCDRGILKNISLSRTQQKCDLRNLCFLRNDISNVDVYFSGWLIPWPSSYDICAHILWPPDVYRIVILEEIYGVVTFSKSCNKTQV